MFKIQSEMLFVKQPEYLCARHFFEEAKTLAEFSYSFSHQLLVSIKEVSTFYLIEVIIYHRIFPHSSLLVLAERSEVREWINDGTSNICSGKHLLSGYCVLGAMLKRLCRLFPLILEQLYEYYY